MFHFFETEIFLKNYYKNNRVYSSIATKLFLDFKTFLQTQF